MMMMIGEMSYGLLSGCCSMEITLWLCKCRAFDVNYGRERREV